MERLWWMGQYSFVKMILKSKRKSFFFSAATISDCFMEAEAAINTCHFCFGNNVCYGGKNASEFHGNSVLIRNPKFVEIS
ncbi:MAG: hypothetical protein IKJ39_03990 [Lachnospiraceae bacterium]|nr:hypothetical protein [Lachnospiraceae bacterium]